MGQKNDATYSTLVKFLPSLAALKELSPFGFFWPAFLFRVVGASILASFLFWEVLRGSKAWVGKRSLPCKMMSVRNKKKSCCDSLSSHTRYGYLTFPLEV